MRGPRLTVWLGFVTTDRDGGRQIPRAQDSLLLSETTLGLLKGRKPLALESTTVVTEETTLSYKKRSEARKNVSTQNLYSKLYYLDFSQSLIIYILLYVIPADCKNA